MSQKKKSCTLSKRWDIQNILSLASGETIRPTIREIVDLEYSSYERSRHELIVKSTET